MPNYEYELKGREIYNQSAGELDLPHFYDVMAGQNNDASLKFHAKIGENYHQYKINSVNQKTLNLVCDHQNCKAKAKMLVKPEHLNHNYILLQVHIWGPKF